MNEDPNPTLLDIAHALADGQPVDWETLGAREPTTADEIARLRAVAEVAQAYRVLREAEEPASE